MTQAGLNAGQRNAQKIDWAIAFTKAKFKDLPATHKKFSAETNTERHKLRAQHDMHVIGAASVLWALSNAYMPAEVMDDLYTGMEQQGMPRIATRDVPPGALSAAIYYVNCQS